jgi:hypothetical protein
MFKSFPFVALALLLAACGAPRVRHGPLQAPAESAPSPLPGKVYRVDENLSELRILVYRAGPLARFGHNHVLVNRKIQGSVVQDLAGSSMFSLNVPAAAFVVDDAQARRDEGPDFAGDVPDDAKTGTLRNLLSPAVLDADEFPLITVNSIGIAGAADESGGGALTATVAVSVAGHESKIDMPFVLKSDPRQLSATGSLELRQSALGLTPYSLMLGALQVKDAVTIKFQIVANLT